MESLCPVVGGELRPCSMQEAHDALHNLIPVKKPSADIDKKIYRNNKKIQETGTYSTVYVTYRFQMLILFIDQT